MEVEIQAGARLDLLSPKEASAMIREHMQGWHAELARNVRWRSPGGYGVATAAGALTVDSFNQAGLGPQEGFVWAVTRIMFTGLTAAETVTVYRNDSSAALAVYPFVATSLPALLGERGCVLNGGDRLVVAGTGLTAGKQYGIALEVTELPVQLGWRLV